MRPWWERFEGRVEYEVAALNESFAAVVVEKSPPTDDALVVSFTARVGARDLRLRVEYPDSFPYLRPHVFAPDEDFQRHQNPAAKNLCLLDRSTRAWAPSQTAAAHVGEQLPKLLEILELSPEKRLDMEVPQGEPISAFLSYAPGGLVLVPKEMAELSETAVRGSGTLRGLRSAPLHAAAPLRGAVTELTERRGKAHQSVAAAETRLTDLVDGPEIRFRWTRVDLGAATFPPSGATAGLRELAQTAAGPWLTAQEHEVLEGTMAVTAVVFREEVRLNEWQDAWAFLVTSTARDRGFDYTARAELFDQEDARGRIRPVAALAEKTVALIGLGALGAPLALELARAQVGTLRIVDFDHHEFAASVRWPFGLEAAGWPKASFLAGSIRRNYPFTDVVEKTMHLGAPPSEGDQSEFHILQEVLAGADIVVDASAEPGVNYLLSDVCRELDLPQVYLWGTEGGWGGVVARVSSRDQGCWLCLKYHLEEGVIEPPPYDEDQANATVQPRSCAARTYIAAGFDLAPIATQAARLTVQTLLRSTADAYPDARDDVMILSLRNAAGEPITPTWKDYSLRPHSRCLHCGSA